MQVLFAWVPGPQELLIVAIVALFLFGSARLPGMMRNLGSSVVEFRKGMKGISEEDDESVPPEKEE